MDEPKLRQEEPVPFQDGHFQYAVQGIGIGVWAKWMTLAVTPNPAMARKLMHIYRKHPGGAWSKWRIIYRITGEAIDGIPNPTEESLKAIGRQP